MAVQLTDSHNTAERLVFFDGVCGLCNRFVDWLIRKDHRRRLLFAPLQGSTAAAHLPSGSGPIPDTVLYLRHGKMYSRSSAVLRILSDLGGPWKITAVAYIVPRFLRDAAYDLIARKRYGWFGKSASCRIPSPEERTRFLP